MVEVNQLGDANRDGVRDANARPRQLIETNIIITPIIGAQKSTIRTPWQFNVSHTTNTNARGNQSGCGEHSFVVIPRTLCKCNVHLVIGVLMKSTKSKGSIC